MTSEAAVEMIRDGLYLILKCSLPILLVSMVIGLIVSILQTITSIQEQTLTFVPKVLSIFATLILLGHWMLNNMVGYMEQLWADFSVYIR